MRRDLNRRLFLRDNVAVVTGEHVNPAGVLVVDREQAAIALSGSIAKKPPNIREPNGSMLSAGARRLTNERRETRRLRIAANGSLPL